MTATDVRFGVLAAAAGLLAAVAAATFGYWPLLPIGAIVVAVVLTARWKKPGGVGAIPVTPSVVLLSAPTLLAAPAINFRVGAVAIAVLAAMTALSVRRGNVTLTPLCAVLPLIALMIVLRPNGERPERAVLFVVACAIIARAVYLSASRTSALVSLIDGVGLFCVVSVALWSVGVTGDPTRTAGLIGGNTLTGAERVIFPLSNGLSVSADMAAAYLVAALPIVLIYRKHLLLRLVAVVCAAAICVLSDARSAILAALLLGVFVAFAPKMFRRVAPGLVAVGLIFPFIYGSLRDLSSSGLEAVSSSASWLTRRDFFSGREFVWSESIEHYLYRIDWAHQFFGFGFRGQAESGVSSYYASNISFGDYGIDAQYKSTHNSVLQWLFDGGLVTAGVIGAVMVWMAVVLARRGSDIAGLAMLTTLGLVAVADISLSPGHMQPPWWVLVALAMVTFARETTPADNAPKPLARSHSSSFR